MKILCLIKFVPDIDNFLYDYEQNVLVRENVNMVVNPDDRAALAFALKLKKSRADVEIEIVSMAPLGILEKFKELLRLQVDYGTLISDKMYVGSDTYVTSKIIGAYLKKTKYDVILSGTHSLDGDTAHVPAQLAECLGLAHMSHIIRFNEDGLVKGMGYITVELEDEIADFRVELPAVLGVSRESKYKLPFVRYDDLESSVSHKMRIVTNEELGFSKDEVGITGSLTKVARTLQPQLITKEQVVVSNDDKGIETVYQFLKNEGYLM
jgi:electron transfer flavoprotein beta subunit